MALFSGNESKMSKYKRYQDYVIKNGEFVGEFEQMYQDFNDPWEQNKRANSTEKAICTNIVQSYSFKRVIELGCGFGNLTSSLTVSYTHLTLPTICSV